MSYKLRSFAGAGAPLVLTAFVVAFGASAGPIAAAHGQEEGITTGARALALQNSLPEAQRIAHERYQFAHRIEQKMGMTFDDAMESCTSVLFPDRRSDRMYLYQYNVPYADGEFHILCYQRTAGKDALAYTVRFSPEGKPRKVKRIRSFLDLLRSQGYYVTGRVSAAARRDLATQQSLTQYTWSPFAEEMTVVCLADVVDAPDRYITRRRPVPRPQKWYVVTPYKFCEEFGYPLSTTELKELLKIAKQSAPAGQPPAS